MDYHLYYYTMADGTVKQVNPFTGTEVWTVSERGNRVPSDTQKAPDAQPFTRHPREDYCAFCEKRMLETAPEKSRVVLRDGVATTLRHVLPDQYFAETPVLRRVPNLFEIVSINYWIKNYDYRLSPMNEQWKKQYLASQEGVRHVLDVLDYKFRRSGRCDEEISAIPVEEKLQIADAFFGGCHELIIANPHYRRDATLSTDLFATGDMTDEEHFRYFLFIIDAMSDIIANNRYVRYLSVFKNWLKPAGASFDHLHTQIVALDEWGERIQRQIKMIVEDKNVFNTYGPNFAAMHNLIFAENEHALAMVGIGHRYPTVEIYSKSVHTRPYEHTEDEVRGVSDIVRACHAAIGSDVSVNEEWYYTPIDSIFRMPWHINIKQRINVPAGFEGGTNIFINPLTPIDLRDRLVPRMYDLRAGGRINGAIRIAEECRVVPNPLQYYRHT